MLSGLEILKLVRKLAGRAILEVAGTAPDKRCEFSKHVKSRQQL
jgi:hypothetical protein